MVIRKINRFFYYLFHEPLTLAAILAARVAIIIPDKFYLKIEYKHRVGRLLDLDNPILFSEKLQWLKLYNRKPEYTIMVDKVKAKKHVAEKVGEEYIIPTLGVWDNPDEINFDTLPDKFVLKCNHNSGTGMCICRDKSKLDIPKVKEELRKGLKQNYFLKGREWPYKNVSRKILAEHLLEDRDGKEIKDYKFMCFGGTPYLCQVISDRSTDEKIDFYDMDWNRLIGLIGFNPLPTIHNSLHGIHRPRSFEDMKRMAAILSKGIPFVRIDFYDINGKAYFGEITFFPASGFGHFFPDEWNERLGKLIVLPHKS